MDSDSVIREIDSLLGSDGVIFEGVLAEEIAKFKLKGKVRREVIRYYAESFGVTQKELDVMVKNRE